MKVLIKILSFIVKIILSPIAFLSFLVVNIFVEPIAETIDWWKSCGKEGENGRNKSL